MAHAFLQYLASEVYHSNFGIFNTTQVLQRALENDMRVRVLSAIYGTSEITDEEIEQFVKDLFQGFKPGIQFHHDLTLAAIAVALSKHNTAFSQLYLIELSRVDSCEMYFAPRIAKSCLHQ